MASAMYWLRSYTTTADPLSAGLIMMFCLSMSVFMAAPLLF